MLRFILLLDSSTGRELRQIPAPQVEAFVFSSAGDWMVTASRNGDVKIWARVVDHRDEALHKRFADDLFERSGMDLRGERFDPFFVADLAGALDAADAGDADQAWELTRDAYAHMFMTGDALVSAIVTQNPDKFPAAESTDDSMEMEN